VSSWAPLSCAQATPQAVTCQHTSAYVSIRQHTSAYVSIRQHTSAHGPLVIRAELVSIRQHTSANVSTRQHTSAEVGGCRQSIRRGTCEPTAHTQEYSDRSKSLSLLLVQKYLLFQYNRTKTDAYNATHTQTATCRGEKTAAHAEKQKKPQSTQKYTQKQRPELAALDTHVTERP
jgi:hypothetical protein